jgi:hypothetical protein
MNKAEIMVVGTNGTTTDHKDFRIPDHPGWNIVYIEQAEAAIESALRQAPDVVILSGQLETKELRKLKAILQFQHPDTTLLEQDITADIAGTINAALQTGDSGYRASFSFTDDALKYARFNINLTN